MTEATPADVILTSYPDNHITVEFHSDFSNDEQFKGIVGHYYADGKIFAIFYFLARLIPPSTFVRNNHHPYDLGDIQLAMFIHALCATQNEPCDMTSTWHLKGS